MIGDVTGGVRHLHQRFVQTLIELLSVRRVLQQFNRLLVGCLFFFGAVSEYDVLISRIIVELIVAAQLVTGHAVC